MKFNFPLNNFSAGEWSPKMLARTDTEQYPRSCKELTNYFVQMQGGAFRRGGSRHITSDIHVGETHLNLSYQHRLFPFRSSTGTEYVLIAGRTAAWTPETPSGHIWFVYNTDTAEFSLVTFQADMIIADYALLQFVQVGDILFFSNYGMMPFAVRPPVFSSETAWQGMEYWASTLVEVPVPFSYWDKFPYENPQALGTGGTVTATGTLTVGGTVTLATSQDMFTSGDDDTATIGSPRMLLKLTLGGSTGVVKITAVTNSKTATAVVLLLLPGTSPAVYGAAAGTGFQISQWRGGAGFPFTVTAYQGRLIWGGSRKYTDTVWGSRIGNVWDMNEVPLSQDPIFTSGAFLENNSRPFALSPNTPEASIIKGLSSAKTLLLNTNRSELVMYGTQGALGPNDFQIESSSAYGSNGVQPIRANNFATFVQKDGLRLRDFVFDWNQSQYKSNDLSFVADHLPKGTTEGVTPGFGGIVEMATMEVDGSVLFCRTNDNRLIYVTLDRDYQINAWGKVRLGGQYLGGDPQITAMTTAAGGLFNTAPETLYFIAKRDVQSITVYYFEKLSPQYEVAEFDITAVDSDTEFPHYTDSWKAYTSETPQTLWSVDHLTGSIVSVIGDGLYLGEITVGTTPTDNLLLPNPVSNIVIGLKYKSTIKPALVEQGAQTGSAVGRDKRVHELYLRLFNTLGVKYGTEDQMQDVAFERGDTPEDEPIPFFTGDMMLKNVLGYAKSYELILETEYPFPCNVLAIGMQGVSYD